MLAPSAPLEVRTSELLSVFQETSCSFPRTRECAFITLWISRTSAEGSFYVFLPTTRCFLRVADSDAELKEGIASFYDASSGVWEEMWGEHMHHGYYIEGKKPKGMEEHRWVSTFLSGGQLFFCDITAVGLITRNDFGAGCYCSSCQ